MIGDDQTIRNLSKNITGRLLRPGDPDFDEARRVWNAMIDRRPALIVQPRDFADVRAAVNHARERGHTVAVRGGGHNIAGSGVCDGGVLIDLSAMRAVVVDRDAGVAHVQGGARLADLDRQAGACGLATPGGVVSSTGVAGLTLGGGFGWLARKHGLAADNLLSLELVAANGEVVQASADENADLFWALRGGGGNFGVVTRFSFRLHELGHDVLFGPTLYRLEDARSVLRHYRQFCEGAPRECCVWAVLFNGPPLPILPERYHGRPVLSLMQCYSGEDASVGRRLLAELHTAAEPLGDGVVPVPYWEAQQFLDEAYAHGARNYWSTQSYAELPDEAIDTIIGRAVELPAPESDILISQLGGAIDDVPQDATAYPHRGVRFAVAVGARWRDAKDDERCVAWARDAGEALASGASGGRYVNFVAEVTGEERSAYGANYERLRSVKARFDSNNLFRVNQNVLPTSSRE
jgi:FAD/FMN-containing dehydrogenase